MNQPSRTLNSIDETRVFGGVLVQPFLAAGVAFVTFPIFLLRSDGQALAGGYPSSATDAALSVAVGVGIVTGVVALIVWPTALWLMRRRNLTCVETFALGLGFGVIPYALMALAAGGTHGPAGLMRGLAFASVLGLSGAAMFWVIAIRPQKERG